MNDHELKLRMQYRLFECGCGDNQNLNEESLRRMKDGAILMVDWRENGAEVLSWLKEKKT